MLNDYRTVADYGQMAIEINKSRFIGYVSRVENEAEAAAFIEKVKKQHWDATHNCSAYMAGINDQWQKADDDGEPSGTAGRPILEVIKKTGLKDTVVVVTRYFGGIKLGAGGLIRAYGKAASAGIKAAGLVDRIGHTQISIEIDYTLQGMLENQLRNQGYVIQDKAFTQFVTLVVLARCGEEEKLENKVTEWTAGRAVMHHLDEVYADVLVAATQDNP
ncbi:MAG: YigZ family protein [Pelosinus sp.]|nr:YigZ family protein [Pelosinus sp.]